MGQLMEITILLLYSQVMSSLCTLLGASPLVRDRAVVLGGVV
jgi:hypothetical protein